MCFRKWFCGDKVPVTGDKIALLFGINDYRGSENDLAGCLNDIDDVEKKLKNEFPGFIIRKFKDSEVTIKNFISEVESGLSWAKKVLYVHYSGHGTQIGSQEALYLYNGPLMDDVICDFQNKTPETLHVIAKFDSCFSGGMDDRNLNPIRYRYYPVQGARLLKKKKRFGRGDVQKWVIFSGCGEEQTSADAYFNDRPNGAFTFYDLQSYTTDSTYSVEQEKLRLYLPNGNFDQTPELTGNRNLFNEIVFT